MDDFLDSYKSESPDFASIASGQQVAADARKNGALGTQNSNTALHPGKYSDRANPLSAPWLAMADGAQPFDPAISINVPVPSGTPLVWVDVINFIVPNGFDAVIQRYANNYNGGGWIQGSGQLVWRMLRNGQAIRNYDNILISFGFGGVGGTTNGIRLTSGDMFEFQVANNSLAGAVNQITCYVGGYFYPKKVGAN